MRPSSAAPSSLSVGMLVSTVKCQSLRTSWRKRLELCALNATACSPSARSLVVSVSVSPSRLACGGDVLAVEGDGDVLQLGQAPDVEDERGRRVLDVRVGSRRDRGDARDTVELPADHGREHTNRRDDDVRPAAAAALFGSIDVVRGVRHGPLLGRFCSALYSRCRHCHVSSSHAPVTARLRGHARRRRTDYNLAAWTTPSTTSSPTSPPAGSPPTTAPSGCAASGYVSVGDFALLDVSRAARKGVPEVVYAEGKSVDQVVAITRRFLEHNPVVLCSRVIGRAGRGAGRRRGRRRGARPAQPRRGRAPRGRAAAAGARRGRRPRRRHQRRRRRRRGRRDDPRHGRRRRHRLRRGRRRPAPAVGAARGDARRRRRRASSSPPAWRARCRRSSPASSPCR